MVSLAIALILVIGINQVFKITTDTVSTGQAMNDTMRDQRAAQSTFYNDWRGAALADSPCIIIDNQVTPAVHSAADEASNNGVTNPLQIVVNGVAAPAGTPVTYNYRNHRTDTLSFFARGNFPRMTGNSASTAPMISSMSSNEAWINYGHLWLPGNTAPYTATTYPGAGTAATNPNNFYADQWILGRIPILLRTPNAGVINDNSGNSQEFIADSGGLTPLAYTSATSGGADIYTSQYDLAATSIDAFRSKVLAVAPSVSLSTDTWWQPLAYVTPVATPPVAYRFQCDPYSVLNRASFTNTAMAQTFPYFLKGCTQFTVEFAGDFMTQDTAGVPTSNVSDGTTDFYIASGIRNVRWYGLPRDNNGDGAVDTSTTSPDVLPVGMSNFGAAWQGFEKAYSSTSPARYLCVFGPSDPKPTMLRITIALTDPGNRLANPQTYEYVLGTP
jgi:hypothetical protein